LPNDLDRLSKLLKERYSYKDVASQKEMLENKVALLSSEIERL